MQVQLAEEVKITGITFHLTEVEAKCLAYYTINRNRRGDPNVNGPTSSAGLNTLLKMVKAIQEVYKDDPQIKFEETEETRKSAQAAGVDAPSETEQDGTGIIRTALQMRTEGE